MPGELGDALEIIKTVAELAERGEREKNRADGLAARNIDMTRRLDNALRIVTEDQKKGVQAMWGAGLQGRVTLLCGLIEAGKLDFDSKTIAYSAMTVDLSKVRDPNEG